MLNIQTMPVGSYQCNCSILSCSDTMEAIIIDPGDEGSRIVSHVEEMGFKVKFLLHTHAHRDHIGGTCKVKQQCGGDIVLHKDDMYLYDTCELQSQMMGLPVTTPPPVDRFLNDEEHYEFGSFHVKALHTPGHTPGSSSFLVSAGEDQVLFAGDTLFRRSVGRTDLPGGNFNTLAKSIKARLFTLDGETVVIPGHGPGSTIGEEIHENPFVGKNHR